jgi:hypothetical protein
VIDLREHVLGSQIVVTDEVIDELVRFYVDDRTIEKNDLFFFLVHGKYWIADGVPPLSARKVLHHPWRLVTIAARAVGTVDLGAQRNSDPYRFWHPIANPA